VVVSVATVSATLAAVDYVVKEARDLWDAHALVKAEKAKSRLA
jgi:hypothetical protein